MKEHSEIVRDLRRLTGSNRSSAGRNMTTRGSSMGSSVTDPWSSSPPLSPHPFIAGGSALAASSSPPLYSSVVAAGTNFGTTNVTTTSDDSSPDQNTLNSTTTSRTLRSMTSPRQHSEKEFTTATGEASNAKSYSTLQIYQRPSLYSSSVPVSPLVSTMDSQNIFSDKLNGQNSDLEVGHLVKIQIERQVHSGVVRWLGTQMTDLGEMKVIAGLEMDTSNDLFSDGTFSNKRYFTCPPLRGLFVYADQCKKDPLYLDSSSTLTFGDIACPLVPGQKPPMEIKNNSDFGTICGRNKGIQGHHNSCYLDATLFSMFAFSEVFDGLIERPKRSSDVSEYEEVQKVLKEAIVNPLRTGLHYVRADNVLHLRHLLDKLGSVTGLTCEEKDPEEFLNSLLQQILKVEPYLKLNSGQESFYYQLFVEKKERITFPTIQYLLQQSFYSSNIKLSEEPSCLIVLMPRFGKQYKMYSRIFPNLDLDVSEIIENVPRLCSCCGQVQASYECIECLNESDPCDLHCAFCEDCKTTFHQHPNRMKHKPTKLPMMSRPVKQIEMKLFAVVCIETSHYVAFVKCGKMPDSPWCFFDSMADRIGGQNGFNVPEVVPCEDLTYWLTNDGYEQLASQDGDSPPNYVNRLLSDAYLSEPQIFVSKCCAQVALRVCVETDLAFKNRTAKTDDLFTVEAGSGSQPQLKSFASLAISGKDAIGAVADIEDENSSSSANVTHESDKPYDMHLIGDSIVRGVRIGKPGWSITWCYPGISDENLTTCVKAVFGKASPDPVVVVHAGTNNINMDAPIVVAELLKHFAEEVKLIRPRARIVISTVLPQFELGAGGSYFPHPSVLQIAQEIFFICRRDGYLYVDASRELLQETDRYFMPDGLHLTEAGKDVLSSVLDRFISSHI